MEFNDKLSSVLSILGLNGKSLAAAIHIDNSLVSRWRSGERTPAKNSDYIRDMSAFFAEQATAHQRVSLLALMNMPIDLAGRQDVELTNILAAWLSNYADDSGNQEVEQFLSRATILRGHESPLEPVWNVDAAPGEPTTAESFWGCQGMRDATMKLMSLLLATDRPQTLYLFSDQSMVWLNSDVAYDAAWHDITMRCLQKGHRIKVIHNVNRNFSELFVQVERWLPLYMTGRVDAYYCPRHLNGIYNTTVNVIPGLAGITSCSFESCEDQSEVRLTSNQSQLNALMAGFEQHLRISRPLLSMYTTDTAQKLKNEHINFLNGKGNNVSMNATLTSISMPEDLFLRSLVRIEPDNLKRRETLRLFQLKQRIFCGNLTNYTYKEIMILPDPETLRHTGLPLNMSMFFGNQDLRYQSYEDIKEHIANIIRLLETYENYQCYLLDDHPFQNLQIQAKENSGVVFTTNTDSYYIFYLTQPSLTAVFYNYLENSLRGIPRQGHDRDYTINRLRQYLTD